MCVVIVVAWIQKKCNNFLAEYETHSRRFDKIKIKIGQEVEAGQRSKERPCFEPDLF